MSKKNTIRQFKFKKKHNYLHFGHVFESMSALQVISASISPGGCDPTFSQPLFYRSLEK